MYIGLLTTVVFCQAPHTCTADLAECAHVTCVLSKGPLLIIKRRNLRSSQHYQPTTA